MKETRGRKRIKEPKIFVKKTRLNSSEKDQFDILKDYYNLNDSELIRASIRNMWSKYLIDVQRKF